MQTLPHEHLPEEPPAKPRSLRALLAVASGNGLEMYDFMVFGYYAASIGQAFFPGGSPFLSLMLSFMTFGVGFAMRPLGAFILGAYIDRHGRRKGLLLTLGIMAVGTLTLALTPSYAAIGLAAPLLVLGGRLAQGLSAGVELGGVSVYLAEIAKPGRRGFYVCWQSASQQIAVVVAAAFGLALNATLPPQAMRAWGWRIPLLAGCLLVPLLLLLRRNLTETEAFMARKRPMLSEIVRETMAHWRLIINGTLLITLSTVSFYFITAYTPTFGAAVLKLRRSDSFLVTLSVGVSNFAWLPLMAALSDRLGRRPLLIAAASAILLSAYPCVSWLVAAPSLTRLLGVELWLSFLYASYNAAAVVYLTEIMPERVRTATFSLAYSLATALFGGFTPAMVTYLIRASGSRAAPGLWLSFAAVCGLIAIYFAAPQRSGNDQRRGGNGANGEKAF